MPDLDMGPTSKDWLPDLTDTSWSSIATYKEAVARLTRENSLVRGQLDRERVSYQNELAALKGQLREGLTPELIALRKELKRWRDRAVTAESRLNARVS